MAQGFGLQIYGTEIDASRMEFARNRCIEVIPPENIPGMECDFIDTEQVLEHVPNPFETVQLLKEGLKKGGILKISVPNGNGALRAMRRIDWSRSDASKCSPMPFFPLEHINTYSTRCLTALGRRAGLQPVRIPVGVWIVDLKLSTWKDSLKVLLGPLRRKLNPRGAYILFRKNF